VLTAAVRLTTALGARVDLFASPVVDVSLTRAHYDLSAGGQLATILSPLTVRPGAAIGLTLR
jgi:hypothetical protein